MDIQKITYEVAEDIMFNFDKYDEGLFLAETDGEFVAIDNSSGNAFTESFETEELAVSWLNREFEIGGDGAPLIGRSKVKSADITLQKAMKNIVEYLEVDESKHFYASEPNERKNHIYLSVKVLKKHLNQNFKEGSNDI